MEEAKKNNLPNEEVDTYLKSGNSDKLINIYGLKLFPVLFHDNGKVALAEVVECDNLSPYYCLKGSYIYINNEGFADLRYGYITPTKFNKYGFLTANLNGIFSSRDKILLARNNGAMCKAASGEQEFEALVEMAILCFNNPLNLKYLLPTLAISDQSALNFMMTIAADGIERQTKERIKEYEIQNQYTNNNFLIDYFRVKNNWFKISDYIAYLNNKLEEIKTTTPQNIFVYSERMPLSLKIVLQADYLDKLSKNYYEIKELFFKIKNKYEKFVDNKKTAGFEMSKFLEIYDKINDNKNGLIPKTRALVADFNYLKLKSQENIDNLPKIKENIDYIISEVEPFVGGGFGWYTAAIENKTIIDDNGTTEFGVSEKIKEKIRETSIEIVDDLADWGSINDVKEKYLISRAAITKDNVSVLSKWCERLLKEEQEFAFKLEIESAYNQSSKVVDGLRDGSLVNNFLFKKPQRGE